MIIRRLRLENWKAVEHCEVEFSAGVTLIEGPNETGKSTLVEAIDMLFNTLHDSAKKEVRDIQPVGLDVGSLVEVEVEAGDCRFVYGKVYNRDKKTWLHITSPRPEQLTGREAHQRVERILAETVDMVLWKALMVEQGKEIGGARLADSGSLARALDEAAGSSSANFEDSDLHSAAAAEYERYFTPKTGKRKYTDLQDSLERAETEAAQAREALAETESDSSDHDHALAEIRRLEAALPKLSRQADKHHSDWLAVGQLQNSLNAGRSELDAARLSLESAEKETRRREDLDAGIAGKRDELDKAREAFGPLERQAEELARQQEAAGKDLIEAREAFHQSRADLEMAREDLQHLQQLEALKESGRRLTRLRDLKKEAGAARSTAGGIRIDGDGVEALREAERQLELSGAKLEAVASRIEVKARRELGLRWDGVPLELAPGQTEQRSAAVETVLEIGDLASVRIRPSQSVMEVEEELERSRDAWKTLTARYRVASLAEAVAEAGKRADAEGRLRELNAGIRDLLGEGGEEDLADRVDHLRRESEAYAGAREARFSLPKDTAEAARRAVEMKEKFRAGEEALDHGRKTSEEQAERFNRVNADLMVATHELEGLEADLSRRQADRKAVRKEQGDRELAAQLEERRTVFEKQAAALQDLEASLSEAMPDTAELLMNNSREALARTEKELGQQKLHMAVLEDRMAKAQASGRFDRLVAAGQECEALKARYEATDRRAQAAALLWDVLNRHRDTSRRAYVQPLKQQIERLGRVVFGPAFSVEVGDDWSVVSRTLDGRTIDFESLSVGAKEQLGILIRLAAAQIVSGAGGAPLMIDDALGFSDPARLESMAAAIAAAGRDCQIILLSCTPGRFQNVGNANVIRIGEDAAPPR